MAGQGVVVLVGGWSWPQLPLSQQILWRQFLKFKETELPAKEADKNRSKAIFQGLEVRGGDEGFPSTGYSNGLWVSGLHPGVLGGTRGPEGGRIMGVERSRGYEGSCGAGSPKGTWSAGGDWRSWERLGHWESHGCRG